MIDAFQILEGRAKLVLEQLNHRCLDQRLELTSTVRRCSMRTPGLAADICHQGWKDDTIAFFTGKLFDAR